MAPGGGDWFFFVDLQNVENMVFVDPDGYQVFYSSRWSIVLLQVVVVMLIDLDKRTNFRNKAPPMKPWLGTLV